ncbi:hypothetical protein [Cutibacterium avidum]|uniref:3-hydroxyacyl-CoA dehydrogenase n=2 Tax=Cutibacterium avidum TaxID=33010 RepID=G4CW78_9ACTN|nr:hypothetical protein [Cutibacterium avidum]MBS6261114.1 3-hydroxyacyl-CoA dehydrogenase [Propionibacterium sp.]AGJ76693.1 hypothetical protein PALO_00300 [Cutibacterium avidum 44067]EGY78202.1 3-hydroxyacyl-CoA dehydrogenase [Cutibacterium avidum ATCC 25577]MCO6662798.1 3-hydroxyacyl-CoA dehydrogenase [Cutibacterium avidum]MCO6667876.1 3-hydroxyacyl-CoA dehydrogenase [Cutibacterium avidum]
MWADRGAGAHPRLDVFAQIDDADLRGRLVPAELALAIRRGNPVLPSQARIAVHDLGDPGQVAYLAGILGVSDAAPPGRVSWPATGSSPV